MVKETRLLIGAEDVMGVLLNCNECGGESLHRLDTKTSVKTECQYCGAMIPDGHRQPGERLIYALRRLFADPAGVMTVRLAIDGKVFEGEGDGKPARE